MTVWLPLLLPTITHKEDLRSLRNILTCQIAQIPPHALSEWVCGRLNIVKYPDLLRIRTSGYVQLLDYLRTIHAIFSLKLKQVVLLAI